MLQIHILKENIPPSMSGHLQKIENESLHVRKDLEIAQLQNQISGLEKSYKKVMSSVNKIRPPDGKN